MFARLAASLLTMTRTFPMTGAPVASIHNYYRWKHRLKKDKRKRKLRKMKEKLKNK